MIHYNEINYRKKNNKLVSNYRQLEPEMYANYSKHSKYSAS